MIELSYDCDGPDLETVWGHRHDFYDHCRMIRQYVTQRPRIYVWTELDTNLDKWSGWFHDHDFEPWLTIRPLEMCRNVPDIPRLTGTTSIDWRTKKAKEWLTRYVEQASHDWFGIRVDCRSHVTDEQLGPGRMYEVAGVLRSFISRLREDARIPVEITLPPPMRVFSKGIDPLIRFTINEPGCNYSQTYSAVWHKAAAGDWVTISGGFRQCEPMNVLRPWLDHCAAFGDGAVLYEPEPHVPDKRWPNKYDAIAERCVEAGKHWPRVILYSLNTFAAPNHVDKWVVAMKRAGLKV